ncbi:MAG: hypothetical protein IJD16_04230 [Desulfovibrio sp.]|nr:hypothetical protein [Desulfovibrio sp.]
MMLEAADVSGGLPSAAGSGSLPRIGAIVDARGKAEASRDIALRLLMNGIPLEQVVLFTGLSEEEVRALRQ